MEDQRDRAIEDGNFVWNDIYSGTDADYSEPDELVLETVGPLPVGRALDVGCGAGGLVVALARRGWQTTGIDMADKAIRAAQKIVASLGLSADLRVADAASWRCPDRYDLVTNCFALPNTRADQARAMQMMTDALAPGGTVVVKDFDSTMRRFSWFATFHLPTVDELIAGCGGLDIVRAEVVETPAHHHGEEAASDEPWTAALLVARKPLVRG
jgi:SAM-dependent methyltransferase